MKVVMYMAVTINGYIARPDGTEEFLASENWDSMVKLAMKYRNFMVGRKTYEINQTWTSDDNLRNLKGLEKVVVSSKPNFEVAPGFTLVSSPQEALSVLEDYPTAFLIGGGTLNASFAAEGLIDEIVLNIEPVVIGDGRQVFAKGLFDLRLELLGTEQVTKNLLQLRYKVLK